MPHGMHDLAWQVSGKGVPTLCSAERCFVARRRLGGERLSWARELACRMTALASLLIFAWCSNPREVAVR